MNNKTLLVVGVGILGLVYLTRKTDGGKRAVVKQYFADNSGGAADTAANAVFDRMTDSEIATVYEFITKYPIGSSLTVPAGSDLQQRLIAISAKYNIFT